MKPEQLVFLNENFPDHHLKFDTKRHIWKVEAYGIWHDFPSTKHKGSENAKKAALAFRDSLPADAFPWDRKYAAGEKTKSKVVGVFQKKDRYGNASWVATWRVPDPEAPKGARLKSKTFAVKKHGDQEAYALAVEHRLRMEKEIKVQGT